MPRMVLTLAIITGNSGEVVMSLSPVKGCEISDLLTVSIDSLYSNLKVVTKPVDIKHIKATLDDIEKSRQ